MSEQQAAIEAVSDFTARQTYRHIRIGMVVAAFALGVSVLYEHFTSADRWSKLCWQGSISAYYWTPAHSVFVGALTAIGLSMIVLTTYGPYENMFLNLAGTMALLVALIPPARPGRCAASRPVDLSVGFDVANNVFAFFLGAAAALATTLALVSVVHKTPPMAGQAQRKAWQVQVVVQAGVLFGLAIWHFVVKHGFQSFAHPASAVLMFVFIFIVVVINAHKATVSDSFRTLYALVQWFMVGSVALLLGVKGIVSLGSRSWDHYILLIEIAMIISFAAFWSLQTAELWKAKAGLPAGGPDLV
ncbi:MAG: uncharacterized protein JWL70_773 [Acidimicrobiia bacterium]|nr:uncharacterized protein [Acidimicrobiia bacterium]